MPKSFEDTLHGAAHPVAERMLTDCQGAPPQVETLLRHFVKHLFKENLGVRQAARACGIGSHAIGSALKAWLGQDARTYLAERRLEVAAALLRRPKPSVGKVAKLVGYRSTTTFSTAFSRLYGTSPRQYRNAFSPQQGIPGIRATRDLRFLLVGALGADAPEARRVLSQLGLHYPGRCGEAPAEPAMVSGEQLRRSLAQVVWRGAEDLPFAELQRALRRELRFPSLAMFDVLCERSREEGREDYERGVELAQLAQKVLEDVEANRGEELPQHEALGWAYVGNALRLAADNDAAEAAFAAGERAWERADEPRDPAIEAELYTFKAGLRAVQRDYSEALWLVQRAIELGRRGASAAQLCERLILRSNVLNYTGDHDRAIEDLLEAGQLVDPKKPYQLVTVRANLVTSHALAGDHEHASALMPEAQALSAALGYPVAHLQLRWTEALLRQARGDLAAAERLFQEVCEGLVEHGQLGYAAVTTLDRAILSVRQERSADVLARVGEALPALKALRLGTDVAAAVALVAKALRAGAVPLEVLQEARQLLVAHLQLPMPEP